MRIVIERMKTAKRIRIEFDDMEVQPIHNDKLLAHDIAIAFQSYAIRREVQAKKKESLHKITTL
ncbi:MAG: hypothetical protein ACI3Z0_03075 [Candidatus Cryptobacteroides sp.]